MQLPRIPDCLVGSPLDDIPEPTLEDLLYYARVEIELIEEGQDGAHPADLPALRRFLCKCEILEGVR